MSLPNYDAWKAHNPADDLCEFCGADVRRCRGWQPDCCDGECNISFRDPDAEYDAMRDDKMGDA